jgi:hypothetical protein
MMDDATKELIKTRLTHGKRTDDLDEEIEEFLQIDTMRQIILIARRCEGVLSALALRIIRDEADYEDFWDIIVDRDKPLEQAYFLVLKALRTEAV